MKDREEEPDHWVGHSQALGEVRVAVRLTNAVDEGLVRRAACWRRTRSGPTRRTRSSTPPPFARSSRRKLARLGLGARGQRMAEYADGRTKIVDFSAPATRP